MNWSPDHLRTVYLAPVLWQPTTSAFMYRRHPDAARLWEAEWAGLVTALLESGASLHTLMGDSWVTQDGLTPMEYLAAEMAENPAYEALPAALALLQKHQNRTCAVWMLNKVLKLHVLRFLV